MTQGSSSRKETGQGQSFAMAQMDLRRVERCREQVQKAREQLRLAILDAKASGETVRDIADRAGLSYQRVQQIVSEKRER